jgi:hypothetical protein
VANTCEAARAVLDRWTQLGKRRRPPPKKEAALAGGTQRDQSSVNQVASISEDSKRSQWAFVASSAVELGEFQQRRNRTIKLQRGNQKCR